MMKARSYREDDRGKNEQMGHRSRKNGTKTSVADATPPPRLALMIKELT